MADKNTDINVADLISVSDGDTIVVGDVLDALSQHDTVVSSADESVRIDDISARISDDDISADTGSDIETKTTLSPESNGTDSGDAVVSTKGKSTKKPKKGKKGKKKKKSLLPPILLCLLGLIILFRPVAMDWYASWQASQKISTMSSAYEPDDDPELVAVRENAEAYNNKLAGLNLVNVDIKPYEEQMIYHEISQMAWIDIPKIEVALPVYHGTSDDALAAGVGHLEGTSLPIGGTSSHCVLTGHSGMQGERMFDDIRFLQKGDTFILHSLGKVYAYRIYDIETVWPHETESLKIQVGRDLCTLITCTPYGVNDHRLFLHAERCEYLPEMEPSLPPKISYWNTRSMIFFAAALVVLLVMISLIIRSRINKKEARLTEEQRAAKEQKRQAKKRKKRKKAGNLILPAVMIITGLIILSSSVIVDWWETWQAQQHISKMSDETEALDPKVKAELLEQAEIYNEVLAGDTVRYAKLEESGKKLLPYKEQLVQEADEPMGWVDIPKISTKIPIYHGTDDNVLMMGAGHVEQSSLPVPGTSVHSVVSAHSGMVLTRMFDEIRVLEPGDVFIFWILDEPYAYQVTDTEVILPEDTASLEIERGADKASLVTCTPYGINDHRLLVHGKHIPYGPELDTVPVEAYFNYRTGPFLLGILIGIPSLILIIKTFNDRRRKYRELVQEAIILESMESGK